MIRTKYISLYVLVLLLSHINKVEAQIKLQNIDFQYFHKSFPLLASPIVLDQKAVIEKPTREEYTRIDQHYAETFLGIEYQQLIEGASPIPQKVPHFVCAFMTNANYHALIYYWFPYPAKREINDNFELVIFDKKGGKQTSKIIAGVWGDVQQFASLREVGKEYIIEIIHYTNNTPQTTLYKITESGKIVAY